MSRRLRFTIGLALFLTFAIGSFAPAVAQSVPTKESMVAMLWHQLVLVLSTDATSTVVLTTHHSKDLPVSTNSCYGTDNPMICLAPEGTPTFGITPYGSDAPRLNLP